MRRLSDVPYMRWAKQEAVKGEFPLTQSAVPALTWAELGMDPATLELYEYSTYGDEAVISRLALPWGIDPGSVFLGTSTTHTHFCFAASLLEPGDRVLFERPGYLCLLDSLSLLRVEPVPYERRFEECFALPRDEIRRQARESGARLLLVTHLHNPSGLALTEDEIAFLGELSDETGIVVLSDEIYRPFLDPDPGPAFTRHPGIISVGGFNKVHGLPLIRVGWGFAAPERVERARRILDATTVHNSCLSDQVARFAAGRMAELEARARGIAASGWEILGPALDDSPLEWVRPGGGLTAFPRLPAGSPLADGEALRARLLEVGVGVVPGSHFGAPRHARIACALPPEALRIAAQRLREVLADRGA